jgi:hypothetical protein
MSTVVRTVVRADVRADVRTVVRTDVIKIAGRALVGVTRRLVLVLVATTDTGW